MIPKQRVFVFDSHSLMDEWSWNTCPHSHFLIAYYATDPEKSRWKSRFHASTGSKPINNWKLATVFAVLGVLLARIGQHFAMRPQLVQNPRARHASMQFVWPPSRYFVIGLDKRCSNSCCSCLGEKFANNVNFGNYAGIEKMCSRALFVQALQTSSTANAREYHPEVQNVSNYRFFWKWCQFWQFSCSLSRRHDTTKGSRVPPQNTTF